MTIEQTRKELQEKAMSKDRFDDGQYWGFIKGVSLAQKEFIDFCEELISHTNGCDCAECNFIQEKLKELKQK